MLRTASLLAAFVAFLALAGGVVDAQVGKKAADDKKIADDKKAVDAKKAADGKKTADDKKTADGKKADPKKDADARTQEGPNYLPLHVGNRWDYTLTVNDKTSTMTSRIARVEMVKGVALAVLESEIDGKLAASEHLRQTDQGVFRFRLGQTPLTPPQIILKGSPKGGDKWNGTFVVGKNKAAYSVETEEEEIEVPAGTFKTIRAAFKIEIGVKASITTTWYAPGVGIVKQSVDGNIVSVLDNYDVKAPPGSATDVAKSAPPKAGPVHYPLAVGNRWEYDITANGKSATMVGQIVRDETVDGIRLAVLEFAVEGKPVLTHQLRTTERGVFRYRSNNLTLTPPLLVIKSPLKGGDRWKGALSIDRERANYVAETEEEEIEVPAGKFKAVRVKLTLEEKGKTLVSTSWYAENIGMIKEAADLNGIDVVLELRSHRLKSAPSFETEEVNLKAGIAAPYPLQVGTRWEYDVTKGAEKSAVIWRVARRDTAKKIPLFVIEAETGGKTEPTQWLEKNEKGIFRHGEGDASPAPMLLVKTPLKAGEKWNGEFILGKEKRTYVAETALDDVDIPLGQFKTIRVKHTITGAGKSLVITSWYASEIGIVKRRDELSDGSVIVAELREYQLGAATKE